MKVIENNFIVGNTVVLEKSLSFWAQWVHMLRVLVRGRARGHWEGEGSSSTFSNKVTHHRCLVAMVTGTGTLVIGPEPEGVEVAT